MSDIQRYDFDKAWEIEKNDDGIYVEYDDHKAIVAQLESKLADAKKDQSRYQWLRKQNWYDSNLCIVTKPKTNLKLGSYCPSLEVLDDEIDLNMIKENQQ